MTTSSAVHTTDQIATIIALLRHGEPISRIATMLHVSVETVERVLKKYGRLLA